MLEWLGWLLRNALHPIQICTRCILVQYPFACLAVQFTGKPMLPLVQAGADFQVQCKHFYLTHRER